MTTPTPVAPRPLDPGTTRFLHAHLKTRHMVLLAELGRHRSILHAAKAIGLTQPGASKLLSDLEHAMGVQLFERLPRSIVPAAITSSPPAPR